jgi:dihydroorotase
MMKNTSVAFTNITITDPGGKNDNSIGTLVIENGKVVRFDASSPPENFTCIDANGMHISPGIFDFQVQGGEPGYEDRERFDTLNEAALAGGVTDLVLMPNLHPVSDHAGAIQFIKEKTKHLPVNFIPAGALSKKLAGKELSEMAELYESGVRVFTDDKSAVSNAVLLHLAMQYSTLSGGLIMLHPEDAALSLGGNVNESITSTQLGLKGSPALAEELGVLRAIALAEYHDVAILLSGISTARSLARVREAKSKGLKIFCSTYTHHLHFTDADLNGFDSNLKVWPPLRGEADRKALLLAVSDGTVDCVCSDHRPETIEKKDVEFGYAAFGMENIEASFGAAWHSAQAAGIPLSRVIDVCCVKPRNLLNVAVPHIEVGRDARFFVYNPNERYTLSNEMIRSLSKNSPYIGRELLGKVYGVCTASGWQFEGC